MNKVLKKTLLLDVDGVVADMVNCFAEFVWNEFDVPIDVSAVVFHDKMGRSPGLARADQALRHWFPGEPDGNNAGVGGAFQVFMKDRDVYGKFIRPIKGSVDAVAELRHDYKIVFVTALMRSARDHFRSKMEWIERWFPGIQIMTSPSGCKPMVHGHFAVDDRYDTCASWADAGTHSLLFRQPWNEIPNGVTCATYDWSELLKTLKAR